MFLPRRKGFIDFKQKSGNACKSSACGKNDDDSGARQSPANFQEHIDRNSHPAYNTDIDKKICFRAR